MWEHEVPPLRAARTQGAQKRGSGGGGRQRHANAAAATTRGAGQGIRLPGDWRCPSCGCLVFGSKSECFKCRAPKPVATATVGHGSGADMSDGSGIQSEAEAPEAAAAAVGKAEVQEKGDRGADGGHVRVNLTFRLVHC